VLYGNSFSDLFFSTGMHEHFVELFRARAMPQRLNLVLDHLPDGTRYFIWQIYEPLLGEVTP